MIARWPARLLPSHLFVLPRWALAELFGLEDEEHPDCCIKPGNSQQNGRHERVHLTLERWYKDLHGNYTYLLLPHTEAELREVAAKFNWGTPFHYDPMPTLRAGTTPQLWILGGRDYEAPSAETSRRIRSLMADGRPFTLALYAQAEHGMTLFETTPGGERLSTRWPASYFALIRDFAREGQLPHNYGDAQITAPH